VSQPGFDNGVAFGGGLKPLQEPVGLRNQSSQTYVVQDFYTRTLTARPGEVFGIGHILAMSNLV
jgi:hypothetical protein